MQALRVNQARIKKPLLKTTPRAHLGAGNNKENTTMNTFTMLCGNEQYRACIQCRDGSIRGAIAQDSKSCSVSLQLLRPTLHFADLHFADKKEFFSLIKNALDADDSDNYEFWVYYTDDHDMERYTAKCYVYKSDLKMDDFVALARKLSTAELK